MADEFVKDTRPLSVVKESLDTVFGTLCAQEDFIADLQMQLVEAKALIDRLVGSTDAGEIVRERDELRDKFQILHRNYEQLNTRNKSLVRRCRALEQANEEMSKALEAYEKENDD